MAEIPFSIGDVVFLRSDLSGKHPMTISRIDHFSDTTEEWFRDNPKFTLMWGFTPWTEEQKREYRAKPPVIHTKWINSQRQLTSGAFAGAELKAAE
jgi:hypothetical protein